MFLVVWNEDLLRLTWIFLGKIDLVIRFPCSHCNFACVRLANTMLLDYILALVISRKRSERNQYTLTNFNRSIENYYLIGCGVYTLFKSLG